jgi:tRNA methyltransferase complex GCD14 subunit
MEVGDWVASQLSTRSKEEIENGFLQHVILDMPAVHKQIPVVVSAMKDDGLLIVFVPSVTQIGDCVRNIENGKLPLVMDRVVELGEGISNGRIWDVRLVNLRKQGNANATTTDVESSDAHKDARVMSEAENEDALVEASDGEPVFVCRPKVGKMTIGGGFVGVWRKADPRMELREDIRIGKPHKKSRRSAAADGEADNISVSENENIGKNT